MTDQTFTLDAPGATITYDVHGDLHSGTPLLLIGSPMDASGFAALAAAFPDRPVVTYDPRGTARSPRTDDADETRPAEHADDLSRVIEALAAGQVDVFASSGGAVNGLALVEGRPELVRTLVAHEPPLAAFLPDGPIMLATADAIRRIYHEAGPGPAMGKFMEYTMLQGEIPADYPDRPAPDAADFGMPMTDDGTRNDPLLSQNIRTCGAHRPDLDRMREAPTRLVIGVGDESGDAIAARGGRSLAKALDLDVTAFPSHHAGFVPQEWGMGSQPQAFAARLREVLDEA